MRTLPLMLLLAFGVAPARAQSPSTLPSYATLGSIQPAVPLFGSGAPFPGYAPQLTYTPPSIAGQDPVAAVLSGRATPSQAALASQAALSSGVSPAHSPAPAPAGSTLELYHPPGQRTRGARPAPVPAPAVARAFIGNLTGSATALDGSGIQLQGRNLALDGIAAPASAAVCHLRGLPYRCGADARDALQELLERGRATCIVVGAVANCTINGDDLSREAVLHGTSWPTDERYVGPMETAKRAHIGLWSEGLR